MQFATKVMFANSSEKLCGQGTLLDASSGTCVCDVDTCQGSNPPDNSKVYIAGLFDTENYYWGAEIFNFTVSLLNNHSDGWFDDVLDDGTTIVTTIADAGCNPKIALPAYWDVKTQWGKPLHAIAGCRCSGASAAVARVAALEDINVVSPVSSSPKLSDKENFPLFSRLAGPDNENGQAGALVNLLRLMGWERITILLSDTEYAKDLATAFGNAWIGYHAADKSTGAAAWKGEISYSHTFRLSPDGSLDEESARNGIQGVPTNEPRINSRVILLIAHNQHAFSILRLAHDINFQPNTIWVGTEDWSGYLPRDFDTSWMPSIPGYIGLEPYRNRDGSYQDYLRRLQEAQRLAGRDIMDELPEYGAEAMVDTLVTIAMALSAVGPDRRGNGTEVLTALRKVSFFGVSGPVSFTAEGDRKNPRYRVLNWQYGGLKEVGHVGPNVGSADVYIKEICWAGSGDGSGCGLATAPSEKYAIPTDKQPIWQWIVLPICIVFVIAFAFRYYRSQKKKNMYKSSLNEMQVRIAAMESIDSELLDLDEVVKKAKQRQDSLIKQRAELQETPETWTDSLETLVELLPDDEQYWDVSDRLRETMDNAWVSKVWRVQNIPLWSYYSFHKSRLAMHSISHNERSVWHGTSSLDPAIIYDDKQDGFMMQFSRQGFWGRGIYFAHKSRYSDYYSFRLSGLAPTQRLIGATDEREMFLAKLLIGNDILMNRDESRAKADECRNLTAPPIDPATGMKYNTVTGFVAGSQVWIVYENGRAYPDYLVRYYCGERDSKRTPFETRTEAMTVKTSNSKKLFLLGHSSATAEQVKQALSPMDLVTRHSGTPSWEYFDATSTWKPYDAAAQAKIEDVYQLYIDPNRQKKPQAHTIMIKSGQWRYEIDVDAMQQTNTEHAAHTKRKVRRKMV